MAVSGRYWNHEKRQWRRGPYHRSACNAPKLTGIFTSSFENYNAIRSAAPPSSELRARRHEPRRRSVFPQGATCKLSPTSARKTRRMRDEVEPRGVQIAEETIGCIADGQPNGGRFAFAPSAVVLRLGSLELSQASIDAQFDTCYV